MIDPPELRLFENSSNVLAGAWQPDERPSEATTTGSIIIIFKGGKKYRYTDCFEDEWAEIVEAAENGGSVGRTVHQVLIAGGKPYQRLEG